MARLVGLLRQSAGFVIGALMFLAGVTPTSAAASLHSWVVWAGGYAPSVTFLRWGLGVGGALVAGVAYAMQHRRRRTTSGDAPVLHTGDVVDTKTTLGVKKEGFGLTPRVEQFSNGVHGSDGFQIVARVTSQDGKSHSARAQLLSVESLTGSSISIGPIARGHLRWSRAHGGGEVAVVSPAGIDLEIFLFEDSDSVAHPAYADARLVSDTPIALDGGWRVEVEVMADGEKSWPATFEVVPGGPRISTEVIHASAAGTLYGPITQPAGSSGSSNPGPSPDDIARRRLADRDAQMREFRGVLWVRQISDDGKVGAEGPFCLTDRQPLDAVTLGSLARPAVSQSGIGWFTRLECPVCERHYSVGGNVWHAVSLVDVRAGAVAMFEEELRGIAR